MKTHNKDYFLLIALLSLVCFSCNPKSKSKAQYEKAVVLAKEQKTSKALALFENIVRAYPREKESLLASDYAISLCKAGRSCEKEEFFLKFILQYSKEEHEIISAQKRLSELYYDSDQYSKAIVEMNSLLSKKDFEEGKIQIRQKLVKSYFYLKSFYQAEVELKQYLKEAKTENETFEGYLLQAEILSASNKVKPAEEAYQKMRESFRELYLKNQVYMNEAIFFEEQKQLDKAISLLEDVKREVKNSEVIQAKVDRIKERRALLPGASGLKR